MTQIQIKLSPTGLYPSSVETFMDLTALPVVSPATIAIAKNMATIQIAVVVTCQSDNKLSQSYLDEVESATVLALNVDLTMPAYTLASLSNVRIFSQGEFVRQVFNKRSLLTHPIPSSPSSLRCPND